MKTRVRPALAVLGLWAAAIGASAQVELAVEERVQSLSTIDPLDLPLERVLTPEQQLLTWIPEGFEEYQRTSKLRSFRSRELGCHIVLYEHEVEPGLGLVHAWELTRKELEEHDFLERVHSVRMLEVAGEPALEVVADSVLSEEALSSRLIFTMKRSTVSVRRLVIHSPRDNPNMADRILKALLRNWWPLENTVWGLDFERLRRNITSTEGTSPALRNRLLAELADPAALENPLALERLHFFAPEELVDGLVHYHPRVRIACFDILSVALDEPRRSQLAGLLLRDPDPVLRAAAAEIAADADPLSLLQTLLAIDAEEARAGAFQLLSILDQESRETVVSRLFGNTDRFPEQARPVLACWLGHWGGDPGLAELARFLRHSRDPEVEAAALSELMMAEHEEALTYAFQRLAEPLQENPLDIDEAVDHIMRQQDLVGRGPEIRSAAKALANAAASTNHDEAESWKKAAEDLNGLAEYLGALTSDATTEDKCAILEILDNEDVRGWAAQRRDTLDCAELPEPRRVLVAEVSRPRELIAGVLDLLGRLRLEKEQDQSVFRSFLDFMLQAWDEKLPDPLSGPSTGLDLDSPWLVHGHTTGSIGRGDNDLETSQILPCSDPQRLVHLLTRSADAGTDLHEAFEYGLLGAAAMPLLPTMMGMIWSDERTAALGEDEDGEGSATETYRALQRHEVDAETTDWTLSELSFVRRRRPLWSTVFKARATGSTLTLSPIAATEVAPESPWASAPEKGFMRVDVDLEALGNDEDEDPLLAELFEAAARLRATFGFDGVELSTSLELPGIAEAWKDLAASITPSQMRAPFELLPRDSVAWLGLAIDPAALAGRIAADPAPWSELLEKGEIESLLDLLAAASGELGLVLVAVPDVDDVAEDPWEQQVAFYLKVGDKPGRDFLKRTMDEKHRIGGRRFYVADEVWGTVVNGFLVFSSTPELVNAMVSGERLAESTMYHRVVESCPERVSMLAGFSSEVFARSLHQMLEGKPNRELVQLGVEALRAFGDIAAWVWVSDQAVDGRVSLRPTLADGTGQETQADNGYSAGSIPVSGIELPPHFSHVTEIGFSLLGPTDFADPTGATGRLEIVGRQPQLTSMRSRAAEALPDHYSGEIDPVLHAQYLRSQPGLGMDDEALRELARSIRGEESDPAKIVRAVLSWVHQNLEYRSIHGTEDAEATLDSRRADCTEFSNLTIALCRCLGIPARPVNGAAIGPRVAILHRWVEVFLDHWYEIDPTAGKTLVPATLVRLPETMSAVLTEPGHRIDVQLIRTPKDGLRRRIAGPEGAGDRLFIAVDDRTVLVFSGNEESAHSTLLVSRDRGEGFARIVTPSAGGRIESLIGGHGHLLWHGRTEEQAHLLFELEPDDTWTPVDLPQTARSASRLEISTIDEGFLLISGEEQVSAAVLDPALTEQRRVTPPTQGGPWVLAPDRPIAAVVDAEEGVSLVEWVDGQWLQRAEFPDDYRLQARAIRSSGSLVEIVCHDPERDRPTLLWWSARRNKADRAAPNAKIPAAHAVTVEGRGWRVQRDREGLELRRWSVEQDSR